MLALLACALLLAEPSKATASEVKKDAADTVDASKRYANEKKEEFEARMSSKMKDLRTDVTALKDKAKNGADATLKDIEDKEKKADAKVNELTKASSKAWTSLKGGVEQAVDDLAKGVEKAKAK
jgi:hypothetical protein